MTGSVSRSTTWALLCGYLAVSSGLPLPLGGASAEGRADPRASALLAAKDRSRNFPCRDKACGCGSAEQCFSSCCCNTPAELAAWAGTNRVGPDLLEALARRAATPAATAPAPSGCCGTPATTDACCTADDVSPTTRRDAAACPSADAPPRAAATAAQGHRTISLRAMLACGGVVSQWLATASAPPPARVVIVGTRSVVDSLDVGDLLPVGALSPPDSPPPRPAA